MRLFKHLLHSLFIIHSHMEALSREIGALTLSMPIVQSPHIQQWVLTMGKIPGKTRMMRVF